MKVHHFIQGKDNWGFILEKNGLAIALDPQDAKLYESKITSLNAKLAGVLLTHYHQDHTAGVRGLVAASDLPVLGPDDGNHTPAFVTRRVAGDFEMADVRVTAEFLPGHTTALNAYHLKNYLFVGDLLFNLGCGRVLEGTHADLYSSLQKLKTYSPQTILGVGHDYRKN